MEATRITATELARNLSDILNRARYRGERFVVERNGEVVANIEPPPMRPKAKTLREFLEYYETLPSVDEKWADDLEAVNKEQPPMQIREW